MIFLDLHILDDVGNLIDACTLGSVVALKSGKMPKVKVEGEDVVVLDEKDPFPIQSTPVACSIAKFGPNLIVDPTNEEEIAMDSKIVFGIDEEGNIRALQKSGSGPWTRDEIQAGLALANQTIESLREKLKLEEIA